MTKNLSFSYSKMGMYKECPQKYKFRYVHLLPEKPKYYFAFGSALHAVMEFIHNPAHTAIPTLPEALNFLDKEWNKTTFEQKGYASAAKELEGYAEGRRIVESYYAQNPALIPPPVSVEMKSTLDIDGLSLISIVDRIDYLGNGRIKILDYKTGKTVQREPDQLYMYQKVAENSPAIKALVQAKDPSIKEVRVAELSFYHLPTLTEMKFDRAPDKEIFEFWQHVLQVADKIRAGKFDPTPGENQCRWCDYRNLCPVFTEKEYTGTERRTRPQTLPPAENPLTNEQDLLSEKIDRLGQLQEEVARLQQDIQTLLEKNHFERHFGKHFKAELTNLEQTDFTDKQRVVNFLREKHLLSKVLAPTKSTVLQLLQDETVSPQIKTQLQSFIQRTKTVRLDVEKLP